MSRFLFLALVFSSLFSFSQFEEDDHRIPNQFIVMLKPTLQPEIFLKDFSSLKTNRCLSKSMNIWLFESIKTTDEDFLFQLQRNNHVKLAQFNHRIQQRSLIPNDPAFNLEWNLQNTGQTGGVPGADIDATDAWDINHNNLTINGDTIVIAMIDGTFDTLHKDLNFFVNYNEVPDNAIDDDGNGYIDDYYGWNVYDTTGNVHGTFTDPHSMHISGIAGAISNNNIGIAGVCWGVKILRVAGSSSLESEVVAAYDYVLSMRRLYDNSFGTKGAFVVATNSSFGVGNFGGNPANYPIWCAMYDSLGAYGILSAGAAPNANVDVDVVHDVPTECPSKWFIGVTNTMSTDIKNGSAAYGKISVDLGAPGYQIYSTIANDTFGYSSGTSMATPHVTGAIAAMYAAACKPFIDNYYTHPDSMALLVKQYLLDGAEWNSSLNNITVTNGRLNLFRALTNMKKFNCDSCNFNIQINSMPVMCKGNHDGAMAVVVDTSNAIGYNILWSNGVTTPEELSLGAGFYSVTVQDSTGCRRFATAELHNPDSIVVSSITIVPVNGGTGNITIHASAAHDTLTYSLDGIHYQTTPVFSVDTNGTYTLYIKNQEGCVIQQIVLVSDVETLSISNCTLLIFPNPVLDNMTVYCTAFENRKITVQIFDATGRKIFETVPQTSKLQLQLSNLANGIYFLKAGTVAQKFSVLH